MDTSIAELLGKGTLPDELVTSLQEAFDKRVQQVREEARDEAEVAIREEFARRYEHDKENLVEAIDRMLTDTVQKQTDETAAAVAQLSEARNAFRTALKEARANYRTKLTESVQTSNKFVSAQLVKHVKKLHEQHKKLVAQRMSAATQVDRLKEAMANTLGARLKKIDAFVVRQVGAELKEFEQDHRALLATRAKLVREAQGKLRNTQSRFVKAAAGKVEKVIEATLKREMHQLHEDLERNRQNMFGRRIFEAVAAEYLTSYLNEGTEIHKLQTAVADKTQQLSEAATQISAALKLSETAARKARLAEDRANRTRVMGELLSTLRGEKRTVMEGMLETVKTEALRETFERLLPVVIDETAPRKPAAQRMVANKRPLAEEISAPKAAPAKMVTGDQRPHRMMFDQTDTDRDEIAQVVRLAGIQS